MKPALLIIDMQIEFCKYGRATAGSLDEAIECINAAIDLTPAILREALASTRPEHTPPVEAISEVISFGALGRMLG